MRDVEENILGLFYLCLAHFFKNAGQKGIIARKTAR
jgi:hypothetical protein